MWKPNKQDPRGPATDYQKRYLRDQRWDLLGLQKPDLEKLTFGQASRLVGMIKKTGFKIC